MPPDLETDSMPALLGSLLALALGVVGYLFRRWDAHRTAAHQESIQLLQKQVDRLQKQIDEQGSGEWQSKRSPPSQ